MNKLKEKREKASEGLLSVVILKGKAAKFPHKCAYCTKVPDSAEDDNCHICDECAKIKKSVLRQAVITVAVSVLLGLCGFAVAAFLYAFDYAKATAVAVIAAMLVFTVFAILKKSPSDYTASFRDKPIKTEHSGDKTVYILQNSAYAEEFRTLNGKNLVESDTFENRYVKEQRKSVTSLFSALKYPFMYPIIAAAVCAVILTAAYRPLSAAWSSFGSYMTNRCIYPDCELNKGDNLYYCKQHKCRADGCERPIDEGSEYCYEHSK